MRNEFINSPTEILAALSLILGLVYSFFQIKKLLAETDPEKKLRETERHRLVVLADFYNVCENHSSFIISGGDTQLTATYKAQVWRAYGVKYETVDMFERSEIDSLAKPLETLSEYQKGSNSVESVEPKDINSSAYEWRIRFRSKIKKWLFVFFSIGSGIFAFVLLLLLFQEAMRLVGVSDLSDSLLPFIPFHFTLFAFCFLITSTCRDGYKANQSAHEFIKLWNQRLPEGPPQTNPLNTNH